MENKSVFINADMLEPYVTGPDYQSIMVMGDELVGEHCINCNIGKVAPHGRLAGAHHEKAELYYIVDCAPGAKVVTGKAEDGNEIVYDVKPQDFIYIPGGLHHWIDNRDCDEKFIIMTMWPDQEQNGMYFKRLKEWGTSFRKKA